MRPYNNNYLKLKTGPNEKLKTLDGNSMRIFANNYNSSFMVAIEDQSCINNFVRAFIEEYKDGFILD